MRFSNQHPWTGTQTVFNEWLSPSHVPLSIWIEIINSTNLSTSAKRTMHSIPGTMLCYRRVETPSPLIPGLVLDATSQPYPSSSPNGLGSTSITPAFRSVSPLPIIIVICTVIFSAPAPLYPNNKTPTIHPHTPNFNLNTQIVFSTTLLPPQVARGSASITPAFRSILPLPIH